METRKVSETRKQTHARHENVGTVDRPFDQDRASGADPFHIREGQLIVSKRDVDHELWNRLVGADR